MEQSIVPTRRGVRPPNRAVLVTLGVALTRKSRCHLTNSRHSQLKGFLRRYRGISTKYLDSYLRWFHLIGMVGRASPRACLAAAISSPCIHFGN